MVAKSSAASGLQAHALELLAPLGPARARRMFGGAGLYLDAHFVALIADDALYLPFCYSTKDGRRTVMAYWSAPEAAMESPAEMRPWALLALESALRAAAAKRTATARKAQASVRQARPAPAGRAGTGKGCKAGA